MHDGFDTDVAIVGAGVVGCAIARELSRYELRVTLLEAGADVGAGTSKANTALLHTGFDAKPGTLEARLVARGYELLSAYAERVGIPVERTGALLVAWDEEQHARFPEIVEQAQANGHDDLRELGSEELYRREPKLGPAPSAPSRWPASRSSARSRPSRSPPRPCWPAASCAARALFMRSSGSTRVDSGSLPVGSLTAGWVVNAAACAGRDRPHAGPRGFTIAPRRGELIVFDKLARPLVRQIVLAVPTKITKGVLIAPTVFGERDARADCRGRERKDDTSLDRRRPRLPAGGGRAHHAGAARARGYGRLRRASALRLSTWTTRCRSTPTRATPARAGFARPGSPPRWRLPSTCASSSARRACARASRGRAAGAEHAEHRRGVPPPVCGRRGDREGPRVRADRLLRERVTRGELRDALGSPVAPADLDGLRRRTRAGMGRCQGSSAAPSWPRCWRSRRGERPGRDRRGRAGAGLSAAIELRRRGVPDVLVLERESEAGGIPAARAPPGLRAGDLHRTMSGPSYARRPTEPSSAPAPSSAPRR